MITEVEHELERDLRLLAAADQHGTASFRTWTTSRHVVVVGRAVAVEVEVDVDACRRYDVPIVRRPSGGRSVVIGPGTLQYTFALPYHFDPSLRSIPGSKAFCNRLLLDALGDPRLRAHDSGDITVDDRKVAGLAMKRSRAALILHGTLLISAEIELLAALLRHPAREPEYRRGRAHVDFLSNLGPFCDRQLELRVNESLKRHSAE
jgi:lipoate-protein ligase A